MKTSVSVVRIAVVGNMLNTVLVAAVAMAKLF